jgi:hypothetical protein
MVTTATHASKEIADVSVGVIVASRTVVHRRRAF